MANSILKYLNGYPDYIGKRFAFACKGTGPSSYNSTAKDVISLPGFQHNIDAIPGVVVTKSGNYYLIFYPSIAGLRATWKAIWYGVGGTTEVTNATDLSAETFIVSGFGGQS